jgi:hypothetical protein
MTCLTKLPPGTHFAAVRHAPGRGAQLPEGGLQHGGARDAAHQARCGPAAASHLRAVQPGKLTSGRAADTPSPPDPSPRPCPPAPPAPGPRPLPVGDYLSLNFSRHGVGASAWLRLGRRMELRTSPQGLPGHFVVQADYSEWRQTAQANKERPYPIK